MTLRYLPSSLRLGNSTRFLSPALPIPIYKTLHTATMADIAESPRKRLKTDNASTGIAATASGTVSDSATESDAQSLKEAEVGITRFVSPENQGFTGIFKKR